MSHRVFACTVALAIGAVSVLAVAPVAGQTSSPSATATAAKVWTAPRTPDGQPDLQGVWSAATITPLERPDELAGKEVLTDEEAANLAERQNRRQNRDLIDPKKGGANYPPESEGGVVPYNEFWYDRGTKVISSKRSALIVDPPDGRIPALTPEARTRTRGVARDPRGDSSWIDRNLWERCITRGLPILPGAYNNNYQIIQASGHVAIVHEMIHDVRVVPLDARPHLGPQIRQWFGDRRGRWEGETLVVETTNFSPSTNFRGAAENLHLVERFTRVDPDTLLYEFTVSDPTTWTRPWTAQIPLEKISEPIYEYACHEGNEGMVGILGGGRAREREEEAVKKGSSR